MIPRTFVFERGPQLLGADTTTLAHATELRIGLVNAPFTPGPALVYGDVTPANFTGSTPKTPVPGTQPESLDPATGDAIIDIVPPAGGFRWETTDAVNLPQTIYGFIAYLTTGPNLLASELLDEPITLTAANQAVVLSNVRLRFLQGMIS